MARILQSFSKILARFSTRVGTPDVMIAKILQLHIPFNSSAKAGHQYLSLGPMLHLPYWQIVQDPDPKTVDQNHCLSPSTNHFLLGQ